MPNDAERNLEIYTKKYEYYESNIEEKKEGEILDHINNDQEEFEKQVDSDNFEHKKIRIYKIGDRCDTMPELPAQPKKVNADTYSKEKAIDYDFDYDHSEDNLDYLSDHPEEYIQIGNYKGYTVTKDKIKVTDRDIDQRIEAYMESAYAAITDRDTVKEDDDLILSYTLKVDGKEIKEHTYKKQSWRLGETKFTFCKVDIVESLTGKKVGDTIDVPNRLIDGAVEGQKDGKKCIVSITIDAIQEPVDVKSVEEYVKKCTDYSSTDEFRNAIKKDLIEEKEEEALSKAGDSIIDLIAKDSKQIKDFSDTQIEAEAEELRFWIDNDMLNEIEESGKDIEYDDYFKEHFPDYKDIEDLASHELKTRCVWLQLVNDIYKINPSEYEVLELGGGEEYACEKLLLKELEKDNNILDPK